MSNLYDSAKVGVVSGAILGAVVLSKDRKEGASAKWKEPLVQAGASTLTGVAGSYVYTPSSDGAKILLNSLMTGVIYTAVNHFMSGQKGYLAPLVLSTVADLVARGVVPKF